MQTNKHLRAAILVGIFALPFIFFWNPSNFFFPFITGKNFAFRIIIELLAGLCAVLALRDSKYMPKRTVVFWAYLAFVAILAAADISGLNPLRSFWSNSERMDGFITQLHLFLYFLIASAMLRSESLWESFLKTSIGASVLMSLYGMLQVFHFAQIDQSDSRVDGKFGNATYLAVYLLFHVFFILYFLVKRWKESRYRWLLIPALLLESIVLYYTATRGDVLGLGFGLFVAALIVAIGERENAQLRKIAIGMIAAAVFVVVGFIAVKNTSFVQNSKVLERFASISATDGTTKARLMVWQMAVQGFEERPLLGWGQENFNLVFSKYYNPEMYGQEPWFDRAHNVFFDWLVSGGILGLAGYLALFASGVWMLFRNPRFSSLEKALLAGLFAGYFFQNLFVFDNLGSYFLFFTLLAFVAFEPGPEQSGIAAENSIARQAGIAFAILLTFFALYYFNVPEIEANTTLIAGLQSGKISDFETALSYNTFANNEIREQLIQAAIGSLSDASASNDDKLAAVNAAVEEMAKQINETPLDVRAKLLDGSLLIRVGLPDQALAVLNDARALSPKKQPILFAIASADLEKNDYPAALAAAKQAYEFAPEYDQAASVYATVAIYVHDKAALSEAFSLHPGIENSDDSILQAYGATKQYAKVASIWKARFANDPTNPDLHLKYASMLSGFGMKQAAISEANQAISIENAGEKDSAKKAAYLQAAQAYIAQFEKGN